MGSTKGTLAVGNSTPAVDDRRNDGDDHEQHEGGGGEALPEADIHVGGTRQRAASGAGTDGCSDWLDALEVT